MTAEKAAAMAGWFGVAGIVWFFTGVPTGDEPLCIFGPARDVCLLQGIEFDE